jgi:acetyl-CoA carboxylase biotin carboxyl carrier protein
MTDDLRPQAVGPGADDDREGLGVEPAGVEPPTVDGAIPPRDDGDVQLLGLIDRLALLLDRSDLTELEVESGGTGLVLRKPSALTPISVTSLSAASPAATPDATATAPAVGEGSITGREPAMATKPSVKAPLTGIFYASPAPGSAPYVSVGGEVAVGQIIGLIEAMKLFNEIKSDLAGRVVRVVAESGALVKAKQPLIEVEPL